MLALGHAIWAVATRRYGATLRERLAAPLAVVFAGFSVWLVAAVVEPVWTTVVIFLVMVAGLLRALSVAPSARAEIAGWSRTGRALLWGLLGIYTGWSSIGVWVNPTTALAATGAPIDGLAGRLGQLAVLVGATASASAIVRWTRGLLAYTAVAGVGLAVLLAVTLTRRWGLGRVGAATGRAPVPRAA